MQLIESGSIQDNHEKYVDIQREIMELNRNSFENYVDDHLFFPIRAKKKKIRAIVYVQFIINEKGKAVETNVIRSVDKDLDKEAIRLVNSMPAWIPGIQRGKNVRVSTTVGIKFDLK